MKIGLIGCGRAGVSIFNLLRSRNQITGVYDINPRRLKRGARLLAASKSTLPRLCETSTALFIAVPDREIQPVFKKIKPILNKNQYLFHLSGVLTSGIFAGSGSARCASAHPFATFPAITTEKPARPYYLFCEGGRPGLDALRRILPRRYFRMIRIRSRTKTAHHLAGVFASNLLIGLFLTAREFSRKAWPKNVPDKPIINIMAQTLNNIAKCGPGKALSGPLQRGDWAVIKKHLAALQGNEDQKRVYRSLSRILLKTIPKSRNSKRML